MYTLHIGNGKYLTSAEIVAMLDMNDPIQASYRPAIDRLERDGMSRSNEDTDILGGAWQAAMNAKIRAA
jgi:hypothetical protein